VPPAGWAATRVSREGDRVTGVDLGLLILRVATGLTIAMHGYNKVFAGGRLAGTARWFESIGVRPGWLHARLAAGTELGGGLLLALGLLTPFAAAAIVGLMVVAAVTSHLKNGFFIFKGDDDGGYEYVLVLGVIAAALGATGAGEASLDEVIGFRLDGGWGLLVAAGGGILGGLLLLATSYRPPARSASAA
jgi:putative oxidoreductase